MPRTLSRIYGSLVLAIPLFLMLVAWSFYDPRHDLLRATEPYIHDVRIRLPVLLFAPSFLTVFVIIPAVARLCQAVVGLMRRIFRRTRNEASAAY